VQIILASFDLLANAVFRNEGPKAGHLLKSYVVNKVPLILVSLTNTPAMYPFDPELCIKEALGQVDTNVFPTLSGMFEMSNNTSSSFHDSVRQDFCFSCQLHGLLSQTAIENLLGDITYQSLPDEGRYVKDNLVQACLQDVDRTQRLIGELDNMNGNVGAASQAIIEVRHFLTCRLNMVLTQPGHWQPLPEQGNHDTQAAVQSACGQASVSGRPASFRQAPKDPASIVRASR
jgi:mediator of RNA polymerase II transcription subunit 5